MKSRPIAAVYWMVLAALLVWALLLHGQALGGVQYFVHVGRGGSAALQIALIAASVLLALQLRSGPGKSRRRAVTVVTLSVVFFLSIFGGFIPFASLLLGFLSPYVYPASAMAIQALVLVSGIATLVFAGDR